MTQPAAGAAIDVAVDQGQIISLAKGICPSRLEYVRAPDGLAATNQAGDTLASPSLGTGNNNPTNG